MMKKEHTARFEIVCNRWVNESGFCASFTMEQDTCDDVNEWNEQSLFDYIMDGIDPDATEPIADGDELYTLKVWNGTDFNDDREPVVECELWFNDVLNARRCA